MQNYCKTIGALAAASALVAGNAQAEIEFETHLGYSSEYVFRGVSFGDNLVEAGLDAAWEWNGLSISGGVWAAAFNHDAANTANDVDNEVDTYAEVSKDFGFATASVGYIYYWNVGDFGIDNQEVYVSLSRDFGFINAYLTYFWDVEDSNNNGYTELGVSKSWELSPCLSLNVGSNVGYMAEEGKLTAVTSKVSLDWGFADHAKVSPFVALSVALNEDAGSIWAETSNEVIAGSILSVSF